MGLSKQFISGLTFSIELEWPRKIEGTVPTGHSKVMLKQTCHVLPRKIVYCNTVAVAAEAAATAIKPAKLKIDNFRTTTQE